MLNTTDRERERRQRGDERGREREGKPAAGHSVEFWRVSLPADNRLKAIVPKLFGILLRFMLMCGRQSVAGAGAVAGAGRLDEEQRQPWHKQRRA